MPCKCIVVREGEETTPKWCCMKWRSRLFYSMLGIVYCMLVVLAMATLGTFGRTFAETANFWSRDIMSAVVQVCVLYGSSSELSSDLNPTLENSPSCAFVFWGAVTVLVTMLVWLLMQALGALLGRPNILSLFRVFDLVMTVCMGVLSLIVSAVLTDGLNKTCNAFPESQQSVSCRERLFFGNNGGNQSFFGNLEVARNTSWSVTAVLLFLCVFYGIMLCVVYGMRRNQSNNGGEENRYEDKGCCFEDNEEQYVKCTWV